MNKADDEELFTSISDLDFRSHFLPSNDSDDSSVIFMNDDDHYFTLSESEDNDICAVKKKYEYESESSDHSTMCETYATDSSTIVSSSDEDRDRANDKFNDSTDDECFLPPLMKRILDAFSGICNPVGGPSTPVMTGHQIELYVDEHGAIKHSSMTIPGTLVK